MAAVTGNTITMLFLVYIAFLLSIFLSNGMCKWQADFPTSTLPIDVTKRPSKIIIRHNVSTKVETSVASTTTTTPLPRNTLQAFVISSRQSRFQRFLQRNRVSLPPSQTLSITWFPAANGRDQTVLDEYAYLTGFKPLTANSTSKGYDSPHHTGCFMSHWNILRIVKAGWQTLQSVPQALFVLEDDCLCATSVMEEIIKTVPLLPPDWDILYVGAKPFTYYYTDLVSPALLERKKITNFTKKEFEDLICQGKFGRTGTGPFAPDGGRNLSLELPYWRIKYITNTQSYLVNPASIDRILNVLEHPKPGWQEPIDIMLAEAGRSGTLNLFMTTMEYCFQRPMNEDIAIDRRDWLGYYNVKGLADYRWSTMFHSQCPSKP